MGILCIILATLRSKNSPEIKSVLTSKAKNHLKVSYSAENKIHTSHSSWQLTVSHVTWLPHLLPPPQPHWPSLGLGQRALSLGGPSSSPCSPCLSLLIFRITTSLPPPPRSHLEHNEPRASCHSPSHSIHFLHWAYTNLPLSFIAVHLYVPGFPRRRHPTCSQSAPQHLAGSGHLINIHLNYSRLHN